MEMKIDSTDTGEVEGIEDLNDATDETFEENGVPDAPSSPLLLSTPNVFDPEHGNVGEDVLIWCDDPHEFKIAIYLNLNVIEFIIIKCLKEEIY